MEKQKLPQCYLPSDDEEYMNPTQLEFFRQRLLEWKTELASESSETLDNLRESARKPDISDAASLSMQQAFELRTRDRYRKLIDKIDIALDRIENGEYGYCDETGEEIGVQRLMARPIATLCIEAQERHENFERQHSEDDES